MIEIYIDQVVRLLNYNSREDKEAVASELRERIYRLLGDRTDEASINEVLSYLGDPVVLSEEYEATHFLIGPRMYKSYIKVLKIMLKVVLIVSTASSMIATLISNMLRFEFKNSLLKIIQILPSIVSWLLYMVVFVTMVFVIIERFMKEDTKVIIDYISNFQFKDLIVNLKEKYNSREDDSYFSKITIIVNLCISVITLTLVVSFGLLVNRGVAFTGIVDADLFNDKRLLISILLLCFVGFNSLRLIYKKWDTPMAIINCVLMLVLMYVSTVIYRADGLVSVQFLEQTTFWFLNEKKILKDVWPDLLFAGYITIMLYAIFVSIRGIYRVIAAKIKRKQKENELSAEEPMARKRYRLVRDEKNAEM